MKKADARVEAAEAASSEQIEHLQKTVQALKAEKQTLQNQLIAQKEANGILEQESAKHDAALGSAVTKEQVEKMQMKHEHDLEIARKTAQDKQIIKQANEQAVTAGKRAREWDIWTREDREELNERRDPIVTGPNCNPNTVNCCLEIIRRSDPQNPALKWFNITVPQPDLEHVEHPFPETGYVFDPTTGNFLQTGRKEEKLDVGL